MAEFEKNGRTYRTGSLDCFKQLHIARKLAPCILQAKLSNKFELLVISEALSEMSASDVDLIVNTCLSVSYIKDPSGSWQKVQSSPGTLQYQEIKLDEVIKICVETIKENLGDFMPGQTENEDTQDQLKV